MAILCDEIQKLLDSDPENLWNGFLRKESSELYFQDLDEAVSAKIKEGNVYPDPEHIFDAFRYRLQDIKVLILGQDPYHEKGQATGLAFAVPNGFKVPPSLRNIRIEVANDTGKEMLETDLTSWAKQGVFLLNTILTVSDGKALSNGKIGWKFFTARAVEFLVSHAQHPFVAILWGNYAKEYKPLLKHNSAQEILILESSHPSPLSAYRGFFGSRPFSKTNSFLCQHGEKPIEWA